MPSGICTAKRRLWVDGDGAPGKGQRANRNALAPAPGLRAMKESISKQESNLILLRLLCILKIGTTIL